MRTFLFLFFLNLSLAAFAQKKVVFDINSHLQQLIRKGNFPGQKNKPIQIPSSAGVITPSPPLSINLANGDKLYALPGDNMPIVAPALKGPKIPNAAVPHNQLIPLNGTVRPNATPERLQMIPRKD